MTKRKRGKANRTPVTGFARQLARSQAASSTAQANPSALNKAKTVVPSPPLTLALTPDVLGRGKALMSGGCNDGLRAHAAAERGVDRLAWLAGLPCGAHTCTCTIIAIG